MNAQKLSTKHTVFELERFLLSAINTDEDTIIYYSIYIYIHSIYTYPYILQYTTVYMCVCV